MTERPHYPQQRPAQTGFAGSVTRQPKPHHSEERYQRSDHSKEKTAITSGRIKSL
jgi:hypothetical protein